MTAENGRWAPGIGDPTVIGWITVIVYFIVAVICLKAAFTTIQNNKQTTEKSIKTFWIFLTLFLVALGINKQFDFQSLLTQIGRDISVEQGWYKHRRIVQMYFVSMIGTIGIIALTFLIKTYHNTYSSIKITLAGCITLFVFIVIRASSFHHIELLIDMKLFGIKVNWLLELGSLVIIGIGAYRYVMLKNYNRNQKKINPG